MNLFDRIYGLHKELSVARRPVARTTLEQRLECSPKTIKRIIHDMRLYLDAPIEYDRQHNGYYYADASEGSRFELPGLWFNASEIVALLAMDQLLESTEPGFLAHELAPIRERLETVLASQQMGAGELARRVRILRAVARPAGAYFRVVAVALVARRRLHISYRGRARNRQTQRSISPQRLVYYRDNWYLDAWCHASDGLRTFALDRIEAAQEIEQKSKNVAEKTLETQLSAGYGIFSGPATHTAVLRFEAGAARWAADARWHPDQAGQWLPDGQFELHIPYARQEELIRDVLAYGDGVEVVRPQQLRVAVREALQSALKQYAS